MSLQREHLAFGSNTVSKVDRYGWKLKDSPGEILYIHKSKLQINDDYQRDLSHNKVLFMSRNWSWLACGALIIAERDGEYWVIDGQHRWAAAVKRADILHMPCIVFKVDSIKTEAKGFLDANTGRKPVTAIGKYKAMIVIGDEGARLVNDALAKYGIKIVKSPKKALETKSINVLINMAKRNLDTLCVVVDMASKLSIAENVGISEVVWGGLEYLHENATKSLSDKIMEERLRRVGIIRLVQGAKRAAAYFIKGGPRVWAEGMLTELNKGCRSRIELKNK
jgi:hypothetical protein